MAGKKKNKKPPSNPARGFATTSSVSKHQLESKESIEPVVPQIDEPIVSKTGLPSRTQVQNQNDEVPAELTPEQLEDQLNESELQLLLEGHREKVFKNASRFVSRQKTERRVLRQSAETLRLTSFVPEDQMERAFNHVQSTKHAYLTSVHAHSQSPLAEEELCARIWALKKGLADLGFAEDGIEKSLVYLLESKIPVESNRGLSSKEVLWGADECLEYLSLSSLSEELPPFDTRYGKDHEEDTQGFENKVPPASEATSLPTSNPTSGTTTPVEVIHEQSKVENATTASTLDDESESHDSDSDIDPKDQLEKYLQFKTRLYRRRPSLAEVEAKKPKKPKGRQSSPFRPVSRQASKLKQRVRKLERDLLFNKEEAQQAWAQLRVRLEIEAAKNRKDHNAADRETSDSKPNSPLLLAQLPTPEESDNLMSVGEFFLSLPDVEVGRPGGPISPGSQGAGNTTTNLRDFGKWTGVHPRRILEETCKARDSKARLTLSPVSDASFLHRHKVIVVWSQPQKIPPKYDLPGLDFLPRSSSVTVEMINVCCHERIQSEALVCTAALFLIFSCSSKEEKVYLRLPATWRSLWTEFTKVKHEQDDAEALKVLGQIQDFVRKHQAVPIPRDVERKSIQMQHSASQPPTKVDVSVADHVPDSSAITQLWESKSSTSFYQSMLAARMDLPIWAYKDDILGEISRHQVLVLCGETGCGKSTQIPAFILENEMSRGKPCKIYCTQPRRISALSLARRVSEELGEKRNDLGTARSLVGYAIRLESHFNSQTRLIYATTGIVMRMLENEHGLDDITHLIVDEVHERTIDSDFLLIILRRLMATRSDLKVILMSATVDAQHFSRYFGNAPVFDIPGRTFPVQTFYLEDAIEFTKYGSGIEVTASAKSIDTDPEDDFPEDNTRQDIPQDELTQYSPRTRKVLADFDEYHVNYELLVRVIEMVATQDRFEKYSKAVLVFLPGIGEIRRLGDILNANETFATNWIVHSLHSTISTEDQERAFYPPPPGVRKIVLATNIAETGITIPDVTCVVDSGKHREMRFDEKRQLSRLLEVFISRANAKQRRGRAGRVQDGLCFHLFSRIRHDQIMPLSPTPEMLRLSLQDLALRVKICKLGGIEAVLSEALDPPLARNVRRAVDSLVEVKALTSVEELTSLGRQLAKLPLDVYLGKLLLFSSIFRCVDAGLSLAAILSSKSPFLAPLRAQAQARAARLSFKKGNSDLLTVYNAYCCWRHICRSSPSSEFQYCRKNFLSPQVLSNIEDSKNQLTSALVEAGFLKLTHEDLALLQRARFSHRRRQFMNLPPTYDENSDNEMIVTSVIAWSFHPKLLVREGKGYRNVLNNQSVSIHPSSVSKDVKDASKFLSFYHIMQASNRFYNAHDCSSVPELAVALLCGDAEIKLYSGILSIDSNRLRFAITDWRSMMVLKAWRYQFGRIVAQGIEHPGAPFDGEQQFWYDMWQSVSMKESNRK